MTAKSRVIVGDVRTALAGIPDASLHCCVTSPPYFGLRDYGVGGQIGLETSPDAYVAELVAVFREVRRVLRDDGTLWLNLGDSYATGGGKVGDCPGGGAQGEAFKRKGAATPPNRMPLPGLKPKDLIGIPWRVAFALQADGWWLRSDIIWHKPNPMPESVRDRPTSAHEHVFLLAKSERYYFDAEAVKEPAVHGEKFHGAYDKRPGATTERNGRGDVQNVTEHRNVRNVWTIATRPFKGAHFATFPPALIEPCIKAGCPVGGTVLDLFFGAGTTGLVANRLGRDALGVELNPAYAAMAVERLAA